MAITVKSSTIFKILFVIVSLLDVVGLLFNVALLELIAKPLIILSLMAIYISSVKNKNYWFLIALFFSFLGDVFLLDKNNMFLLGIAAFLITQLIYIKIIMGHLVKSSSANKMTAILPFAVFFMVLINILFENLDGYLWPVVIYGLSISMFGVVSLLNYITNKSTSTRLLLLGALLFIASDSMIALNKFYEPQEFYSVSIMITYILAQYFICRYMISKSTTT
ncbi:MAG: lysoplasmalogenase [Bacteroidia bacterium]|nr:lysoplasmalogenase [Bacteroidia bacterium]